MEPTNPIQLHEARDCAAEQGQGADGGDFYRCSQVQAGAGGGSERDQALFMDKNPSGSKRSLAVENAKLKSFVGQKKHKI